MLQGFKNRTYNLGDRVRVYRNLNKGGWSILAMSGENKGRVVAHVDYVTLEAVDFVISKAGLARAQVSKVRNVHSYAQGILNSLEPLSSDFLCNEITYNPFKKDYFYPVSNVDQKLTGADCIFFAENKAFIGMYSI